MAKARRTYVCQNCGVESAKWVGKCPSCQEWNTYREEIVSPEPKNVSLSATGEKATPRLIDDITGTTYKRISTGQGEFDRILGGGMVPGSIILLGGEPGIGKSTLALQVALKIENIKTLYVSGEESGHQIKLRAERLGIKKSNCYILSETSLENILNQANHTSPGLLVIDSIQTLHTDKIESSPGSVSQVRECAAGLLRYAKTSQVPVMLIGHITKEGSIAGPKVLEHIVDAVFQFEGDQNFVYRIIRAIKNRFGATSEIGIFEMQQNGLREVKNPSEILLTQHSENLSGISIASAVDGIRPFLIEVQALTSTAAYGTPQRSATGFDLRRLNMLLAVLEKRAGFKIATRDVFLNIAGGIRVDDPAIDLAVITSILSSAADLAIDAKACFSGEIGLTGEIRPVNRIENRIAEAEKLGFEKIFISSYNKKSIDLEKTKIEIIFVSKTQQVFKHLFG